jgi:N-acetylneuraminic acid mutarotase
MFGGIQDVTKEKNDVYIYETKKGTWSKIHTTTNSIYDCSPTLKKSKKEVIPYSLSPVLPKSRS